MPTLADTETTIIPPVPKDSPETDIQQNHSSPDGPLTAAFEAWQRGGSAADHIALTVRPDRSWARTAGATGLPAELQVEYRFTRDDGTPRIAATVGAQSVPLDRPLRLLPVNVDKPWGREIWFTGMESRGESHVATDAGTLPISSYLALAPQRVCSARPMVLLKLLDPHPQPVIGDLYFEVHERKREVYVVTNVDANAWPDGKGRIRLGMNQKLRAQHGDDAAFRSAYLSAVKDYESVRRAIDDGEIVDGGVEQSKRHAMERFTALRELGVGDVVTVPTWLPHSLQHGVRVAEFQTPNYERYIISFAQRVLTQDHWDTEVAVANMRLDAPALPRPLEITPEIAEIAAFDDFRAWRVNLQPGTECSFPTRLPYAVCMNVIGTTSINDLTIGAEQACLVPAGALPLKLANPGRHPTTTLVAAAQC